MGSHGGGYRQGGSKLKHGLLNLKKGELSTFSHCQPQIEQELQRLNIQFSDIVSPDSKQFNGSLCYQYITDEAEIRELQEDTSIEVRIGF